MRLYIFRRIYGDHWGLVCSIPFDDNPDVELFGSYDQKIERSNMAMIKADSPEEARSLI